MPIESFLFVFTSDKYCISLVIYVLTYLVLSFITQAGTVLKKIAVLVNCLWTYWQILKNMIYHNFTHFCYVKNMRETPNHRKIVLVFRILLPDIASCINKVPGCRLCASNSSDLFDIHSPTTQKHTCTSLHSLGRMQFLAQANRTAQKFVCNMYLLLY